MKVIVPFMLAIALINCIGCNSGNENATDPGDNSSDTRMVFDAKKWNEKEGDNYLYRQQMLKDIVYNDTIRSLTGQEILSLLGDPDRSNEGHLYYTISQKKLGLWPLHTKTMVIKLKKDSSVEWIKISE